MINKKLSNILFASLFLLPTNLHAEESQKDTEEHISFRTNKLWDAGRWYLIGKFFDSSTLEWIDARKNKIPTFTEECMEATKNLDTLEIDYKENPLSLEVLRSDQWFAIELDPLKDNVELKISSGSCEKSISLPIAWSGLREPGELRASLFLKPTVQRHFGKDFSFRIPEYSPRADIQLDLLLGYWNAKYPGADTGSNTEIQFLPSATTRGEWLMPFYKKLGLAISLEQTVKSVSSVAGQSVLLADWSTGFFYQEVVPVFSGWLIRGGIRYRQHLGDDTSVTLYTANSDARYVTVEGLSSIYFGKRWLIGGAIEYGWPQRIAGNGIDQGYLSWLARIGIRPSSFLTLLVETGGKSYTLDGFDPETIAQLVQIGIRLEL